MYHRRPRMDFGHGGPPGPRMGMQLHPRMDFNGPPPRGFNFPPPPPRMPMFNGPTRMDIDEYDNFPMFNEHPGYYNENHYYPPQKVHCGELREHHAGITVEISGKVHKQRLGRFLTLKDTNGMTQLIVPDDKPYLIRKVTNVPIESFMSVIGTVSKRPKNQRNTIMSTGSVEVLINKILSVHMSRNYKEQKTMMTQFRYVSTNAHSLKLTSEEFKRCVTPSMSKRFSNRTHNCGELNVNHNGLIVTLCGWIESKQSRFVQIRDGYGLVQAVVPTSNSELSDNISNCEPETLIELKGIVNLRPESQVNLTMRTGQIEIQIQEFKVITAEDSAETGEDENDLNKDQEKIETHVNSFTNRSFNCGQLRDEHIGQKVILCGWLEFHRVGKFVILRDAYGRTQLIIPDENKEMQQEMDKLPYESVIQVEGIVTSRPPGSQQPNMATGDVEVVLQNITVLNQAKALPFNIRDFNKAKEPLRMQYRYLDLRYAEMQRNIRTRSKMLMNIRDFLINQADFVDVETPTLFRPTPGGAQEFVVPTRTPGEFYSLVQSPQQFKQMLMAGAIDRYFQIARCYRDEGTRPDRQPEFTQLDLEMSFTNIEGVIDLIERLLKYSWPKDIDIEPLRVPFQRISYEESMATYGSDKPDTRISNTLIDCTDILKTNESLVRDEDFEARALVFKKPFNDLSHSLKAKYEQTAKSFKNVTLVQNKFTSSVNDWITSISNLLGDTLPKTLAEHLNLEDDCVLFLAFGNKKEVRSLLGRLRLEFVTHLEERGHVVLDKNKMEFFWIVDFPLFENGENGELITAHHPFTAPNPEDISLLDTEPLMVRAQAYDLVLNGNEVGGGSIRIHNADQQKRILNMLNIEPDTMKHLLDALSSGCPPHGGIALGLDRLLATLLKVNSIRDVIAFPKGVDGRDPLSGAPVQISEQDQKLYHLQIVKDNEKNDELTLSAMV